MTVNTFGGYANVNEYPTAGGRVIDYAYDALSRRTTETWYDDLTDAEAQQDARKTYATTYDPAGRVESVGDGSYDFD